MDDLRSGKQFWDEASLALGFTSQRGYEEKNLLHEPYQYKELFHTGRETEYGDYTMEVKHDVGCDDLSRQIAIETGQAKEIAPGVVEFKTPHVYYVGDEKHTAVVGDKWQPEICKPEIAHGVARMTEIAVDSAAFMERQTRSTGERQAIMHRVRAIMAESRQAAEQGMER